MQLPIKSVRDETDDISLGEIWAVISARRWLVVVVTLLSGSAAALIAWSIEPSYQADVLVAPAEDKSVRSSVAGLAGQFGGLASLAGVSLGTSGGSNSKAEAVATMGSRALTEAYIRDQSLLPTLFFKRWNAERKAFELDRRGKVPTLWDGNKLFGDQVRTIAEDKKSGLITLSIEWRDPVLAALWANDIVKLTNRTLRERAIAESNRNLAYLNAQLEKNSVVELRQAIFRLIESEVKNVMVAQGSEEYAFKVIDPAVVPEEKSKPKRGLFVFVGFLLGLLSSCFYALLRPSAIRRAI